LFSRQGIASDTRSIIVDGITSGYLQIRNEIVQRIGSTAHQLNADFVILAHWSTYIAALFAMLHAQMLVMAGQIELTVEIEDTGLIIPVPLTSLLVFFLVNILMIFPPLLLWRAILQRRFFSQQLGKPPRRLLNLISFSIVIILSITAILWLVISPTLEINGG